MKISTHVLDTRVGMPAVGVRIFLEWWKEDDWQPVTAGTTDSDGRGSAEVKQLGAYRLRFDTADYFGGDTFYPEVHVVFHAADRRQNYHVPLLVSPFGYTTYRGS